MLALSQLSRRADEGEREPRLSDLRESGSIEHDSNNVIFLHRTDRDERADIQKFKLIIAKNRNGPLGWNNKMLFIRRYAKFEEETTATENVA